MASLHHLFRTSSPEPAEVPHFDTPPTLIDLEQPDFTPEIVPGHIAPVYTLHQPGAEVTHVELLAQGWSAKVTSLMRMGEMMIESDPNLAVIFAGQPRVNLPSDRGQLRSYLHELSLSNIGERRTNAVYYAAMLGCQRFGLDRIRMKGHSLGGVDVTRAADKLVKNGQIFVERTDLIGTAGLQHGIENIVTLSNLRKAGEHTQTTLKSFDRPNLPQITLEGLYALTHDVSDTIIDLRTMSVQMKLIDMYNDLMFSRRTRPDCIGETDYIVIDEGLACHCAPGHESEIPILLKTTERMKQPVLVRPALLSLAA